MNKKKTAYEFARDIDQEIEQLSDADYLLRGARGKILQEELLPLSRLGLHLKQPGLEVEIEAFENSGEADGHIRVTGFKEREFDVQVTCVYSYEESLRHELLFAKGTVPGTGDIYRDEKTKQVIAKMTATDASEHVLRTSRSVIELYKKKAAKPYSRDTVLIIAFDEHKLYGRYYWGQLFALLEQEVVLGESRFIEVYLFNNATNQLQRFA